MSIDKKDEPIELYPGQKGFNHAQLSDEALAVVRARIKEQARQYRASVFGKDHRSLEGGQKLPRSE